MSDLLRRVQKELAGMGAGARRRLSQNFMVDPRALEMIAQEALGVDSPALVEIGPGLGFLTEHLLAGGRPVVAVEKDRRLAAALKKRYPHPVLTVIENDVLETDLAGLEGLTGPVSIAGNIPYNITSPILQWMIRQRRLIRRAVLTVQWEVAERLCAEAGTKAWGALSVFVQFYCQPRIVCRLKPSSFYPSPKVDSAVICLEAFGISRVQVADEAFFFDTVRRAFQKRRKMLLNALENRSDPLWAKSRLVGVLQRAGIEPSIRPERLSIADWAKLCEAVRKEGNLRTDPVTQDAVDELDRLIAMCQSKETLKELVARKQNLEKLLAERNAE